MCDSTQTDFSLAAFGGSVSAMEHFGRQLQRELAALKAADPALVERLTERANRCEENQSYELAELLREAANEIERLKELVRKHSNDAMNYHADVEKANMAFEWLERKVFEGKWDGTLGAPKSWHMAGPYRHELVKMRGNTLLEAIYNAMKEEK